jgi:hypothetical protein
MKPHLFQLKQLRQLKRLHHYIHVQIVVGHPRRIGKPVRIVGTLWFNITHPG